MKTRPTILIADDEPNITRLISVILGNNGYSSLVARDGEETLRLASTKKPDLILLDLIMPGNGMEVLKKLRTFSSVPVIIVSARHDIIGEAMKLGADSYITKPFVPDKLLESISSVLQNAS